MQTEQNRWLRLEEAAMALGVSIKTLHREIARLGIRGEWRGEHRAHRVLRESDVSRILDERAQRKAA